jgi:hypothetical protein
MFRLLNPVLHWGPLAKRRRRHFFLRTGYIVAPLFRLWAWLMARFDVPASKMPEIGEVMFIGLLGVQFFALRRC